MPQEEYFSEIDQYMYLEQVADEYRRLYKENKELKDKIESLEESLKWLDALERAGVDNWSGIDFAYKELERIKK